MRQTSGSIGGKCVSPSTAAEHMGDMQAVGHRQRLPIDLAAADDADFVGAGHAAARALSPA